MKGVGLIHEGKPAPPREHSRKMNQTNDTHEHEPLQDPCSLSIDRAHALIEAGKWQAAINELSRALQYEPDSDVAHYLIALCYYQLADYRRAEGSVKKAIALNPDFAFAHWLSASIDIQLDRTRTAEASIKRALELDPDEEEFHATHAVVLMQTNRYEQALKAAEHALSLEPEHETAGSIRTMALAALARHDEAAAQAEGVLKAAPDSAIAWYQKGHQLFVQGKLDESHAALLESLRIDPENEEVQSQLMKTLSARGGFFSLFWRWTLFLMRFEPRTRYAVTAGLVLFVRVLYYTSKHNPELSPYLTPIVGLWIAFVIYTWLAQALFHTAVRKGWIK